MPCSRLVTFAEEQQRIGQNIILFFFNVGRSAERGYLCIRAERDESKHNPFFSFSFFCKEEWGEGRAREVGGVTRGKQTENQVGIYM